MDNSLRLLDAIEPVGQIIACPACYKDLDRLQESMICRSCNAIYPIIDGIPDLTPPELSVRQDKDDWLKHWSPGQQHRIDQKLFSFYRKAVFARTVKYFTDKYFPDDGIFVEAGAGTSETSMRMDKKDGRRILIAIDIAIPILMKSQPVMDIKLGGDIFRLPFHDDTLDGIWNVGVMEHFDHSQIDRILQEFHRVLKPGAPLILLWPGIDSIPQLILRCVERIINKNRSNSDRFRFHPEEISKLKSIEEGRNVIDRNGYEVVYIEGGMRSLMAFKTLVGRKIIGHNGNLERSDA